MASYDADAALTAVECVQFTGANITALQVVCRDARIDPTEERTVTVPIGGSHGQTRRMFVGDWLFSVTAGEFVVLPNASFLAIFNVTA